jgi:predicted DNA-binding ribbon-helix-helix protein
MKSLVVKRSIVVAGNKTSVSLEDAFWSGLKKIVLLISSDKVVTRLAAHRRRRQPKSLLPRGKIPRRRTS